MKRLVMVLLPALVLSSCAAAAPYAGVAQAGLDAFNLLLEQHKTAQVPVINCEHEVHPPKDGEPGKILMLCEAEL